MTQLRAGGRYHVSQGTAPFVIVHILETKSPYIHVTLDKPWNTIFKGDNCPDSETKKREMQSNLW